MGAACGYQSEPLPEEKEFLKIPAQGVTLGQRHYSARDIYIIVKLQAYRRAIMARRRVQRLRFEMYNPGYNDGLREDFENVNV
jgi:hypothetical protein